MINLNQLVAYEVKIQSDTEYRVSAYKQYPVFVEYEYQIFTSTEEDYKNDVAIMSYLDELYTRYAYPYT